MDKISFPYNKPQIDPLIDEANNSFIRLQNEVFFRDMLRSGGDSQKMFSKEIKLDFKKKKVCPKFGRLQIKKEKDVSIINFSKIIKTETKSFD